MFSNLIRRLSFSFRLGVVLFLVMQVHAFAAKEKEDASYELSSMKVFNRAVLLIKEQYVDPTRFQPREMLLSALRAIERKVPEIVIDEPQETTIGVRVGAKYSTISIGKMNSLWDLSFKLRDFFKFFEANLSKDTNLKDIEYAAVNGALSKLDPHSILLEPSYSNELHLKARGEFGGLGVVIGIRDGVLTVISPIEGTPAFKAGVKALDRITKIGEEATINMPLEEAVDLLRGEPGSTASLSIERKGESAPIRVNIVREIIKIESVSKQLLSDGVGYIKVKSFDANTARDVESMLEKLKEQTKGKLKGLVLDFRNNPGGLLDQSINIADLFLDGGMVVGTQVSNADRIEKKFASSGKSKTELPLIVLVNGGSASASEIVAGAIKNRDRGLVLGQQTFGKGSVQVVYDFPDRSSLKLTIAQYLTPGNESIQSVGITPDFEVNPVFASELNSLSLFGREFPREQDQESHLDNAEKVVKRRSVYSLKYLDALESIDELEARLVSNKFVEDYEIGLARRILSQAKGAARNDLLDSAKKVLEVASKEQETKIFTALKKLGIDWTSPPKESSAPQMALKVLKPVVGKAGEELTLELEAQNLGDKPAHQVYGTSKSTTRLFEGREFVFGKINPKEKKRASLKIKLPKDLLARRDLVRVEINANNREKIAHLDVPIQLAGAPKPVFAYSAFIDDSRLGNGDGYLQEDERVDLVFNIKNIGAGNAAEPVILLKNAGGPEVFIDEGRKKLSALKAGETLSDKLSFTVRKEAQLAKVEVYIYDSEMGVLWKEKLEIPVRKDAPQITKRTGKVVVNREISLFEEPSAETPFITKISAGSVGEQLLQVGDMVRVRFSPTLSGFVNASMVSAAKESDLAQKKDHKLLSNGFRRVPPKIDLASQSKQPITAKESFKLDVKVSDTTPLKDAWIFVNDKKVYYKQFDQMGPIDINFATDVKLKSGVNVITMVARKDANYAQSKTISVFSEVGDPLAKEGHSHELEED